MIRIDSTISIDPKNGNAIDTTTDSPVNARHPKAGIVVKALGKFEIAIAAIASLNECDVSAPYIRDFLKKEIPTTLPFLFTEKPTRRIDSTQSKKSKPKPKTTPSPPKTTDTITLSATANITHNTQRNGIDVSFNAKPSSDTIAALKQKGFKWSGRQSLWYCPHTDDTLAWANATLTASKSAVENTTPCIDSTPPPTPPATTSDDPDIEVTSAYIIPTRNGWIAQPIADRIDSTPPPTSTPPTPAQLIAAMLAAKQNKS